jgi:hypothetical protein
MYSIQMRKFRETFFQFGCLLHEGLDVWIGYLVQELESNMLGANVE